MTQTQITLQTIFDAAWQKFIIEDAPPAQIECVKDGITCWKCVYICDDGRRCSVGLVLPDDVAEYGTQQSQTLANVVKLFPYLFTKEIVILARDNIGREYLTLFQLRLHDYLCINGQWKFSKEEREQIYREIAQDYCLTIPGE